MLNTSQEKQRNINIKQSIELKENSGFGLVKNTEQSFQNHNFDTVVNDYNNRFSFDFFALKKQQENDIILTNFEPKKSKKTPQKQSGTSQSDKKKEAYLKAKIRDDAKKRHDFKIKLQRYFLEKKIDCVVKKCGVWAIPKEQLVKKKNGTIERVKTPFNGTVQIHEYATEEGLRYGYYGLETCKNSFFCPTCSSKILAVRRAEIQSIVKYMLEHNCQVLLLTQTAPHTKKTKLKSFVKKFQTAQKKLKESRAYNKLKEDFGLVDFIRSVECTLDTHDSPRRSGPHWHVHYILFFDKDKPFSEKEASEFRVILAELWYKQLEKVGLCSENEKNNVLKRGTDISRPWTRKEGELSDHEKIMRVADYICKSLSFEIASQTTKEGRKAHRISHYQYLYDVVSGLYEDKNNMIPELVDAFYRRTKITMSHGLKERCGLIELTDDDIMAEKKGEMVYEIDPKEDKRWIRTVYRGLKQLAVEILEKAVTFDMFGYADNVFDELANGVDPLTGECIGLDIGFLLDKQEKEHPCETPQFTPEQLAGFEKEKELLDILANGGEVPAEQKKADIVDLLSAIAKQSDDERRKKEMYKEPEKGYYNALDGCYYDSEHNLIEF